MINLKEIVKKMFEADKYKKKSLIVEHLSNIGYHTKFQKFKEGENILAEKKGFSKNKIIISTHYDGVGAYDNSGGVVVLMDLSKKIRNYNLKNSVQIIFFDQEEIGQKGSKYFLNSLNKKEISKIIYNLNLDGVGVGSCIVSSDQFDVDKSITDSTTFLEKGIPSKSYFTISKRDKHILEKGIIPDFANKIHTLEDNPEIIEEKSLKVASKNLFDLIKKEIK
ncbi:MAG: M20/M25/M40 family metallo-hydrolase, partial [Nanoarchaeota archaeon]